MLVGQRPGVAQVAGVALDRVFLPPDRHLFGLPVALVVVIAGVRRESIGLGLDQGRALAPSRPVDRLPGDLVAGQDVIAVDHHAGEAVACGSIGEVRDRHLARLRHGDGVAVVFADEDHAQLVDASEIHRLVGIALAGTALTEIDVGDGILFALFGGERHTGGVQQLGRHRAAAGHDVQTTAAEVSRHLPASTVGILAPGKEGQHLVARRHAEPEDDAGVAVVGRHPVVARPQRRGRPDLGPFLSLAGDDKGRPALAVDQPHALIDGAGEAHHFVDPPSLLVAQAQRPVAALSTLRLDLGRLDRHPSKCGWRRRRRPARPP